MKNGKTEKAKKNFKSEITRILTLFTLLISQDFDQIRGLYAGPRRADAPHGMSDNVSWSKCFLFGVLFSLYTFAFSFFLPHE